MYFYCSNQVFMNIVNNKSLWLSDMTKSNDYAELQGYFENLLYPIVANKKDG